jgi:sulfate adenylyltransferase subunit 1 (EFTu-like GTPase family)
MLKLEVAEGKRLGSPDRDGNMSRLAVGQINRAQRFNELVATPETATKVIAELALKLAIDTASVARAAFTLHQSGNVSAGALLLMKHRMSIPDDDLAGVLARAAEEQVTAPGWSPVDGLGDEIEATIAEIAEKYNASLLVRSLADTIVARETAQSGG